MTMYATLQMDREIDPNIHYISIGGFELRFSNGVAIAFDFNSSVANIRKDPSYIRFECDEPDFDSFPEAELLEWMLVHSEVEKIEEFYVYTGEEYEEVINPNRIDSMSFAFDGRILTIPESLLSRYHFE